MKRTRINARLDQEASELLDEIAAKTGHTTSEILRASLRLYGEHLDRPSNPASVLKANGFVGCADGPEDLSSSYKAHLAASLDSKT
jgi:hypothetical protein